MKAGRGLDALIAEKVMGERVTWFDYGVWKQTSHDRQVHPDDVPVLLSLIDGHRSVSECEVPRYSTDIAVAWQVFNGFPGYGIAYIHGNYVCRIYLTEDRKSLAYADADTAPLAICRAALETVS